MAKGCKFRLPQLSQQLQYISEMTSNSTAVVLIGYQNDYFAADGILRGVIEEVDRVKHVLENTISLLKGLAQSDTLLIATPIIFTPDYSELSDPQGILKAVKDSKAFCEGTPGADTIDDIKTFGERILEIPGKRGLNAFSNTELSNVLKERGVTNVVFAGAVTSVCIDSSARAAFDQGFKVSILSDCTTGRTMFEQEFYCNEIFPIYASVLSKDELIAAIAS